MPKCWTQCLPSSPTCASLPEALQSLHQGLLSSIRLARVEKLLLLRSRLPPWISDLGPSSNSRYFEEATAKPYVGRNFACGLIVPRRSKRFVSAELLAGP
jgi:hypothetical protein